MLFFVGRRNLCLRSSVCTNWLPKTHIKPIFWGGLQASLGAASIKSCLSCLVARPFSSKSTAGLSFFTCTCSIYQLFSLHLVHLFASSVESLRHVSTDCTHFVVHRIILAHGISAFEVSDRHSTIIVRVVFPHPSMGRMCVLVPNNNLSGSYALFWTCYVVLIYIFWNELSTFCFDSTRMPLGRPRRVRRCLNF